CKNAGGATRAVRSGRPEASKAGRERSAEAFAAGSGRRAFAATGCAPAPLAKTLSRKTILGRAIEPRASATSETGGGGGGRKRGLGSEGGAIVVGAEREA